MARHPGGDVAEHRGDVGVAYHTDLDRALTVAREACRGVPEADAAREPEAFFKAFGASSIDMTVRVWLGKSDQISFLAARSAAIVAIKKGFDAEGISIPFPIRTLDFGADQVGGIRADAMRFVVGGGRGDRRGDGHGDAGRDAAPSRPASSSPR